MLCIDFVAYWVKFYLRNWFRLFFHVSEYLHFWCFFHIIDFLQRKYELDGSGGAGTALRWEEWCLVAGLYHAWDGNMWFHECKSYHRVTLFFFFYLVWLFLTEDVLLFACNCVLSLLDDRMWLQWDIKLALMVPKSTKANTTHLSFLKDTFYIQKD